MTTGAIMRGNAMPLALTAVISLSAANRLNACSVATSTAIGSVMAMVNGSDSTTNSKITSGGSPLPTSCGNCLAM